MRIWQRLPYLPVLLVIGCGADEGGLGEPDVGAGPVAPITLEFSNHLSEDVYVEWPGNAPRFVLMRDTTTLVTHRGCMPFCGDGCACDPCSPTAMRVRRIPAGEKLSVAWEPVHFAVNACNGTTECQCVEQWPVTAGHYDLSLSAFTEAEGGESMPDDPNVLVGATPSARSRSCSARGEFDLAGGATVTAKFVCL